MTNERIDKMLAEAMGYPCRDREDGKSVGKLPDDAFPCFFEGAIHRNNQPDLCRCEDFAPSTDEYSAVKVMNWMHARGYDTDISGDDSGYVVTILDYRVKVGEGVMKMGEAHDKAFPLAVSLAVVEALEKMETSYDK